MMSSQTVIVRRLLLFIVLQAILHYSHGLRCFSCTYTQTASTRDLECVYAPRNVTQGQPTMSCRRKYCTVIEQVMKGTGEVRSFSRGCEIEPRGNDCTVDTWFKTCFTTCTTDLCNGKASREGRGLPGSERAKQHSSRSHKNNGKISLSKRKKSHNHDDNRKILSPKRYNNHEDLQNRNTKPRLTPRQVITRHRSGHRTYRNSAVSHCGNKLLGMILILITFKYQR